jgi:phospholipid/cholesterol/gamma-HCH transport system substrate-binding protein
MYSRINYTTVGIFVLIFTIGMIWFAFWLAKYGLQKEFDYYKVQMSESVSGLSKDSTVKLHGVDVGSISEIKINPKDIEKVEIVLKINKGTPIKEDMVVFTEMYGVTGISYLQIDGGTNEAKTLEPTEDYFPVIATAPSWLNKTTRGLGSLADRIASLVDKSQKILSEKNIETLGKVFDNTEKITAKAEEVEQKAINSLEEVDITLREFRTSMDKINKKFTEATADFKEMKNDFASIKKVTNPMIDKLMETSKNFNRVTLKVEKSLDRGDYNLKQIFEPMLIEIEVLSQQINDLAQQLEQSPNDLLFRGRTPRRGPGE